MKRLLRKGSLFLLTPHECGLINYFELNLIAATIIIPVAVHYDVRYLISSIILPMTL
jgi:hypothetical protein